MNDISYCLTLNRNTEVAEYVLHAEHAISDIHNLDIAKARENIELYKKNQEKIEGQSIKISFDRRIESVLEKIAKYETSTVSAVEPILAPDRA